jgi:tetratricopeptide (TPR) repeat protein
MTDTITAATDVPEVGDPFSVPPALTTGARARAAQSASGANSLLMATPAFSKNPQSVTHQRSNAQPAIARFWEILESDGARAALAYCWEQVNGSTNSALRWSNYAGIALRRAGEFREALRVHHFSAPFAAETSDDVLAGNHHHGLAITLRELHRFEESEESFRDAEKCYRSAEHFPYLASTYNNLAVLMIVSACPSMAFEHLEDAQALCLRFGLRTLWAECQDTRARALMVEGRFGEAVLCAAQSVFVLESVGESRALDVSKATLVEAAAQVSAERAAPQRG